MKTASFVILALVGAATLALSLLSARIAYVGEWRVGQVPLAQVVAASPGVGPALRGARGTAAAYAAGYAVLFLVIVLGPYRRGERWAWWAILGGVLTVLALVALRVPSLGTQLGVGPAIFQLAVVVIGLLLDVGRLRSGR
jgi:hypothetical protein